MAYLDAYLQPCPGFGWQGGPEFNTRIVDLASGRERRNAEWAQARHKYEAPFNNISRDAYRNVKQMHLVCKGRLHCFRFRDELDYSAANDVFGFGDGVATVFQLGKVSTIDGISYDRECFAILGGASVTVDGAAASPTIDLLRGIVTFASAPADGAVLRWSGEFDIWVRFDQDYLPFSIDNSDGGDRRYINGSITLLEVPPPEPEGT